MRLFLDSSAIIYLFEGAFATQSVVQQRLLEALASPSGLVIVSRLSRLEGCVMPLRRKEAALLVRCMKTFWPAAES